MCRRRPSFTWRLASRRCVTPTVALARAVNVDATASLVRAAEAMPSPPRFVHASSMAVYGGRNPHRFTKLLTPETSPLASELYGWHKLEAENIVRSSDLEWSVLRLSGVTTLEPLVDYGDFDSFYFAAIMPEDRRSHSVDSRDVAAAFAAAITTDSVREIFMIAGDDSHKRLHGDVARKQRGDRHGCSAVPRPSGGPRQGHRLVSAGAAPPYAAAAPSSPPWRGSPRTPLHWNTAERTAPAGTGQCPSRLAGALRRRPAYYQDARSLRRSMGQDPAQIGVIRGRTRRGGVGYPHLSTVGATPRCLVRYSLFGAPVRCPRQCPCSVPLFQCPH